MKQDNFIRDAIDESLSGVHFTRKDMHAVLRAAENRGQTPARRTQKRKPVRLHFAFAMAMLVILIVPIALFALRAQSMRTGRITAAPGTATAVPQAHSDPKADLIVSTAAPGHTENEGEAIRIARACFEKVCDTSIFTFEEYAVSVEMTGASEYTVTMESIYGNGCRFTAVVSLTAGGVLSHSTPKLATMPACLSSDAPEIQAWYDKNGTHLFTWTQDAQAEFSRRYEGAALRAAGPDELTEDEARILALEAAAETFEALGIAKDSIFCYPVLYSERASNGGEARYVVRCFDRAVTDELPAPCVTVSFTAKGHQISVTTDAAY